MTSLDPALASALISAVVAFTIIFLNTFLLEPMRRGREETEHRKQLLLAWIAHMQSNLNSLENPQNRLYKLDIDDRPLDRLALKYPDLVTAMSDVRRRISNLNELLDQFHGPLSFHLGYAVRPDQLSGSIPTQQIESGEFDTAVGIRGWRDAMLSLIDETRKQLSPKVKDLIIKLRNALDLEGGKNSTGYCAT